MAESTKPDDLRRNRFGYNRNFNKEKNSLDQLSTPSSALLSNVSCFAPGRGVIDAQTYVDAQSNGLAKRIVRYDEENKNKKTPNVYNRAYKRPGDFPIVHLQKPKLLLTPHRGIANAPKMARVGQPDPCINRTNIRAEILRNGTMMPPIPVDHRREDVDSVRVDPLDALKEISRKRIHCEDTINQMQPGPIIEKDSTDSVVASGTACNSSKRQRITSSFNSPSSSDTDNKKGKVSAKCNEILSSLSSSSHMLSSGSFKRARASPPNYLASPSPPPQAKRIQSEKSIETPPTIDATIKSVPKPTEKTIVPQDIDKNGSSELARPKLTLFNRPYDTGVGDTDYSATTKTKQINKDRNDECGIQFVKPRPMTARYSESVDNWLKIRPDQERRLSLMLKCLSG